MNETFFIFKVYLLFLLACNKHTITATAGRYSIGVLKSYNSKTYLKVKKRKRSCSLVMCLVVW